MNGNPNALAALMLALANSGGGGGGGSAVLESVLADFAPAYSASDTYSKGEYRVYDRKLYRAKQDIGTAEAFTAAHWELVDVGEVLETLEDGSAHNLTAAKADNLAVIGKDGKVAPLMTEDKIPYNFRPAGGSADIGNRAYDTIVGGTLAWNQLVQNGNFANRDNWDRIAGSANQTVSYQNNTATVTCLTSNATIGIRQNPSPIPTLVNDKVLFNAEVYPSNATHIKFGTYEHNFGISKVSVPANTWTKITRIGTVESGITIAGFPLYVNAAGELSENDTVQIQNVFAIDLTQMFGTAIANYVYGLEQATPGAGVAWFRKLFPKDCYAYDAGSLQSVQAASHDMVGFNAYDHSTGKAVLLGGNQYQITGAYTALSYEDADGNAETVTPDANGLFTTTNNGTLTITGGDGTTTCVHLVWSGYRNGEYEPYDHAPLL